MNQETSIFIYADGEDHGTCNLCDEDYIPPVLPGEIAPGVNEVK